jgi:membrane-associated phospholipid phosphatase
MPRRAVYAMAGAAVAAVLLLITWYLAFHVSFFREEDAKILSGFAGLHRPRSASIASFVAQLCNPNPYVYLCAAVVLVALLRRRPGVALVIVIFGANTTTQVLKPLLAAPRPPVSGIWAIAPASWPSGHATAALSLALCAVLAAPARIRPAVAAIGAVFAVAVSYSFLTLTWHYPSDVFGGFLVATAWTLMGIAALLVVRARRGIDLGGETPRASLREALRPPAAALLGALLLGALVALARPHQVIAYAQSHTAFVVGAASIGALGLMLATGVMLALRR